MTTLPAGQLAARLRHQATGVYATEAAVELLIAHGRWPRRRDFLDACVAITFDSDPGAEAHVLIVWDEVPAFVDRAPCSTSEARILRLATELAGVTTGRPLEELLSGLDDHNSRLVLDAITHVLTRGHTTPIPGRAGSLPAGVVAEAQTWAATRRCERTATHDTQLATLHGNRSCTWPTNTNDDPCGALGAARTALPPITDPPHDRGPHAVCDTHAAAAHKAGWRLQDHTGPHPRSTR